MLANADKIAGCSCDQGHALFTHKSFLHLALVAGTSAKKPKPIAYRQNSRETLMSLKTLKCNKSDDVTKLLCAAPVSTSHEPP